MLRWVPRLWWRGGSARMGLGREEGLLLGEGLLCLPLPPLPPSLLDSGLPGNL